MSDILSLFSSSNLAVICVALALLAFFGYHIVAAVRSAAGDKAKRDERTKITTELSNEIINGGNLARIGQLRKRLRELDE